MQEMHEMKLYDGVTGFPQLFSMVFSMIHKHRLCTSVVTQHVCVSLFSPSTQNGSMPYSFTMSRGLLLLLLFYTGLLPFVPIGESLLQFYVMRIFNRCDCRECVQCILSKLCACMSFHMKGLFSVKTVTLHVLAIYAHCVCTA